jgi:hypothetical protein
VAEPELSLRVGPATSPESEATSSLPLADIARRRPVELRRLVSGSGADCAPGTGRSTIPALTARNRLLGQAADLAELPDIPAGRYRLGQRIALREVELG